MGKEGAANAANRQVSNNEDDASSSSAAVVDFDALNAALGTLPPAPTSSSPAIAESQGRSNATYSSIRPHAIPASHAPSDDPNAPAVIVQTDTLDPDDTVQTGPPLQMTVPMRLGGIPSGHQGARLPSSPPVAPYPVMPLHLPSAEKTNLTVRMAGRPRRPHAPTIIMRTRGPTKAQKLLVFIAMLVVFVGGGIAFLVIYRPPGLNLEALRPGARTPNPTGSTAGPTASSVASGTTSTSTPTPGASGNGSSRKAKPQ